MTKLESAKWIVKNKGCKGLTCEQCFLVMEGGCDKNVKLAKKYAKKYNKKMTVLRLQLTAAKVTLAGWMEMKEKGAIGKRNSKILSLYKDKCACCQLVADLNNIKTLTGKEQCKEYCPLYKEFGGQCTDPKSPFYSYPSRHTTAKMVEIAEVAVKRIEEKLKC